MKSIKYGIPLIIICFIIFGCIACSDWEQEIQIPNTRITDSKRVVVLEDFTGTSCPNCPAGIAITDAILNDYPNNVIIIGIHSKFLAAPTSAGQKDLRTKDAEDIEIFLGGSLFGKPEAAFNRLYDNVNKSFRYGQPDSWKTFVENELKKAPIVDLKISSNYDSISRELKVSLHVTALEAINEPIHLHCGIAESNLISDQLDKFNIIKNFVHKHVLRKMLSPIPGNKIGDVMTVGQIIDFTYSYILPVDWKPENCDVFAYASLGENKKYILQGAEVKLK